MSWMATSPSLGFRSCRGTRWWGASQPLAQVWSACPMGSVWESPGWAGPAAPAAIAGAGGRTCARTRSSPGYTRDGGYGEYCIADARYCLPIGGDRSDVDTAPLLCAGLIGYRALSMAGDAERLGLYGFGAAAHIIAQVARAPRPPGVRLRAAGRSGGDRLRPRPRRRVGRPVRTRRRRRSSTRRCSSHPSVPWCRRRCARSRQAAPWSAPAST